MIVESDNLSSNDVLAAAVGGSDTDDSYTSALSMTATLRELGLEHTYMTMPYESSEYLEGLRGIAIQRGPAQEGPPPYTAPDPVLRTTPAEIARLFLLIDQCSQGGGELLERFDTLSPARCQEMLDLLARNGDQSRMRARLPAETRVEHKSGWVSDMQADVGIVRSPGGDFLLAIYLWYDTDYMYDSEFIPTLAALAHLTYTAYNPINLSEPAAGTAPATSPETASDAQGDAEAAHNAATNLAESNDLDEPDEPDEPAP
jgi:beta-lactamase class A